MEAQVAAALEVRDYQQVTWLLKQWQANDPQNPMLWLYVAQMQERTDRLEAAQKNYLKLLKQTPSSKIMNQARAGIARIQQRQNTIKAEALDKAKQLEGGAEVAMLAIAAPEKASHQQAIQGMATVFKLDAYTARLKVPTSGFRLHRIGAWGEVSYYVKALHQAKTPAFAVKVNDIKAQPVFQIEYFEKLHSQPIVVCKNAAGQLCQISFDWSDVTGRVSGQLPVFEQVVDIGNWGRTIRKEQVQDYAQVLDLHLQKKNMVLRLCDRLYQYPKGVSLFEQSELNSRLQWNQLLHQIAHSISSPHYSDFGRFGKGALEFIPLLPPLNAHLDIDRRAPSDWDLAFHLYSSLCAFNVAPDSAGVRAVRLNKVPV